MPSAVAWAGIIIVGASLGHERKAVQLNDLVELSE